MTSFHKGQEVLVLPMEKTGLFVHYNISNRRVVINEFYLDLDFAYVSLPPDSRTYHVDTRSLVAVGPPGTNKEALHLLSQEEEAPPSIERKGIDREKRYVTSFVRTPEGHAYLPQGEPIGESLRRSQNMCEELMPTAPRVQSPHTHAYVSSLDDYLLPGRTTEPDWDALGDE